MKKRGISAIVATVLIILITVAGIAILWVAMIPIASLDEEDLGTNIEEVEILTAGGYTVWDEATKRITVQIERTSGGEGIVAIDFIFTINGNTITERVYDVPKINQKKLYAFYVGSLGKPERVQIALVHGSPETAGETSSKTEDIALGDLSKVDLVFIPLNGSDPSLIKFSSTGTVFYNLYELGYSNKNYIMIEEQLIPGVVGFQAGTKYLINFTSGVESGKSYYVSGVYDNYTYGGYTKDALMSIRFLNVRSGDKFNIYEEKIVCGNNICQYSEYCSTCVEDCGKCDGVACSLASECNKSNCVHNICRSTPEHCGDLYCDAGENCTSCFGDCGGCNSGDGICEATENCFFQPGDCGVCSCGNGVCGGDETFDNCWVDCGYNSCGNGICEAGETSITCSEDCGQVYQTDIYTNFNDWTNYSGNYSTSPTTNDTGRNFTLSPAIDVGNLNEQTHHWVTINFTATSGGKVRLILGHSPTNNTKDVMQTYYRTNFEGFVTSNQNYYMTSQYRSERYSWIILEKDPDVTINSINHTYWVGYGTAYGHKAKTYKFANSYLPYRIMYPRVYDPSKSYPLVVSAPGSGNYGTNNINQMAMASWGAYTFRDYYYRSEFDSFSLVPQIPFDNSGTVQYIGYYPVSSKGGLESPYHPDWPATNKDSFYAEATVALINDLLENPNMNIDENRVYFTGFSYGGKASYELAKEAPDLWAAIWSVAGWPIGGAYSNHLDKPANDPLIVRLNEEVATFKNIPFLIGSGELDDMKYGGTLACNTINAQGGTCIHNIYTNCDHVCSMSRSYSNTTLIQWVFSQTKS